MAEQSRAHRFDHETHLSLHARFAAANRDRLRRARASLGARQRDFLDLLPLLVHGNHPTLPGYVAQDTPAGVHGYRPGPRELGAAQRLTRTFAARRRTPARCEIEGLYLIGSPGSIGFAAGSDLDLWLCHVPGLESARLAALREKARRLELWAAELGLDAHFFVFDAPSLRAGTTLSLSADSSGSSQHCLLLDEFYRSGLVVCGRTPLWWLVPPQFEDEYPDYVAELRRRRFPGRREHIDFGGVGRVPAEEFFGAGVWQLYKSINAPYKSVLKLLLMEVYAGEYPDIDLLCMRYKRALHAGVSCAATLDPYVQVYTRIEQYLLAQGDTARLDLLRRCFYLKTGERLTVPVPAPDHHWRRELLEDLVQRWGWPRQRLALLDTREAWKVDTVLAERRDLVGALTRSYRFVSRFARDQAGNPRITAHDLTVLGRKLYAAFERKAGKVELVNRGIGVDLSEPRLALHEVAGAQAASGWALRRAGDAADGTAAPVLKRARGVVEVLTWAQVNGLLGRHTHLSVHTHASPLCVREVRQATAALASALGGTVLEEPTMAALAEPPRLRAAALFVNLGVDPRDGNLKDGEHLASSRSDALSYGALRRNLARAFELVLVSTWGEVFVFEYRGAEGLLACLSEYLRWSDAGPAPRPAVSCFTPAYGATIAARVAALFAQVAQLRAASPGRFLIEIEHVYHLLELDQHPVRQRAFATVAGLQRELERPATQAGRVHVAAGSLDDSPLCTLLGADRPGVVQVFARDTATGVEVHVLDEHGALFVQHLTAQGAGFALEHYARFLGAVARRVAMQRTAAGTSEPEARLAFARVYRTNGRWRTVPVTPASEGPCDYYQVQVLGDVDAAGSTVFTIYCEDREFSSLEHGGAVFDAAARHVLAQRTSGLRYPIYITDMDLSPALLAKHGIDAPHSLHYLRYKKIIERRLARLAPTP